MSESKGDYYADDFMEREPELKPEPPKMKIGDRVMVKRFYRSRGFGSNCGWRWEYRRGSIVHVTPKTISVRIDIQDDPNVIRFSSVVERFPIDRVRLIDPPTE